MQIQQNPGFTLIEVVIVTALLLILSVMAVPMIDLVNQREREERFLESLLEMRSSLDLYLQHTGNFPASMGTLIATGIELPNKKLSGFYLRRFPLNPLTGSYTWEIASKTFLQSNIATWVFCPSSNTTFLDPLTERIVDIRASSTEKGINNIAYNEW